MHKSTCGAVDKKCISKIIKLRVCCSENNEKHI